MLVFIAIASPGCGVKGDPQPPERPPSIGRGRPNFQKASKEISVPAKSGIEFDNEELIQEYETDEDEEQ